MPGPSQPAFRGHRLQALVRGARARDERAFDRMMGNHASGALRQTLETLDEGHWYPAEAHLELAGLVLEQIFFGDRERFGHLVRIAVAEDLRLGLRRLLRVMSPSFVVHRLERLLNVYSNHQRPRVVGRTPISADLEFELRPGSQALRIELVETIAACLEHSGAEDLRIEGFDPASQVSRTRIHWA